MAKYTSKDIKRVASALRRGKSSTPISLLTGAGCSFTANIPLAGTLVKEIHLKFEDEIEHRLDKPDRQDYGQCMGCLTPDERRDILDPHLQNAKINWGHIAIASMMEAGFIGRVLTFNFDSILAKACGLVGLYPATYDFVSGATQNTEYIADQAILHLHGQGHGSSILNTEEETKKHAENLRPLLADTFKRAPIIVIGYSGESDAVFPVIESVCKDTRLYWAGYQEDPAAHISRLIKNGGKTSEYLGGADSDQFLINLAQELGCFPPKLFAQPSQHLLDELAPVVDYPLSQDNTFDYLKDVRTLLEKDATPQRKSKIPSLKILAAKGKWDDIIANKDKYKITRKSKEQDRDIVAWAHIMCGIEFANNAKIDSDGKLFKLAYGQYKAALDIKPDYHEALNNWGLALAGQAKLKDTKNPHALFEKAGEKYKAALDIKSDDHEALNNWGATLAGQAKLKDTKNPHALFEKAGEKFKAALDIKPGYHEALYNWGTALDDQAQLKDTKNPHTLFEKAGEKYKAALDIKPDDHDALYNWTSALVHLYALSKEEKHLDQALKIAQKAAKLNPDKAYNLACCYALRGDEKKCREYLEHCKEKDTLPSVEHLQSDSDMSAMQGKKWFKDLLKT